MDTKYVSMDAKMFSYENWIDSIYTTRTKSRLQKLLLDSGFSIVNFVEYNFPVKGYTCIWLLAESHLAIHTFPDQEKYYLQISSCSKEKMELFTSLLNKYVLTKN